MKSNQGSSGACIHILSQNFLSFISYFHIVEQVISPLVDRTIKIYALYFGFCFSIVQSDYLELLSIL